MKKNLLFVLFFVSGLCFGAAPQIVTPTPYQICDTDYDGTAIFNLSTKNSEILGSENPSLNSVAYYLTYNDANLGVTALSNLFTNLVPYNQTVFARVTNLNTGEYALTTLSLVVMMPPIFNASATVADMKVYENPFDGIASFHLTSQREFLLADQQLYNTLSFHLTETDANTGINAIANENNYNNISNPQTLYVRILSNASGCYVIRQFNLIVENGTDEIIFIPDVALKAKLLQASYTYPIAYHEFSQVKIDINGDNEIQVSEALAITKLILSAEEIASAVGIQAFTNLKELAIHSTQLNNINLAGLNNLERLDVHYNQLTDLDGSIFPSLKVLNCFNNPMNSLNIQGLTELTYLDFHDSNLTNVSVAGLSELKTLIGYNSQLTTLNLTGTSSLETLWVSSNALTTLDFTGLVDLKTVNCGENQLTALDFSGNPAFVSLVCNDNNLEYLNIKNGSQQEILSEYIYWENNPNLTYICIDAEELEIVEVLLTSSNLTNVSLSEYCNFEPGGSFNTITGSVVFDENENGCDANDGVQSFIKLNINDGIVNNLAFTNTAGIYNIFTQDGSFELSPKFENPSLFIASPPSVVINFANVDNSTQTQNFCITPNGIHPDIEIAIAPIVPARPGFPAIYEVVYKNIGNQTLNQQYGISFFYNQNLMNFTLSNPAPETQNTGALNWSVNNLQPFESRSIYVTMNINAPTATNPVNIDDILTLTANAIPATGETNTQNNIFQFNQTVVGSYDPNDKQCVEGDIVPPLKIGEYLHYLIRFENTGNYYAENIVVKDVIDATKFDVSSLQIMSSSHPVEAKVRGNIAEFIFKNINLDSGGHGNILLKLKTKVNLTAGTTVSNKADIYFDYNHPIITNFANTTFQELSVPEKNLNQAIKIYPNPTNDVVNIKADSTIRSIQVYDVQGRILISKILSEENASVDLSSYSSGIYYLKINSDNGAKTEKLIKK